MKLAYTRAMIRAALTGALAETATVTDPVFELRIPRECPGVPTDILQPENTWGDKNAYRAQAQNLAERFLKNFERFAKDTPEAVRNAGPRVAVSR